MVAWVDPAGPGRPYRRNLDTSTIFESITFMASFLILGDIHGCWFQADKVIRKALKKHPGTSHIIQCGDLGDGWPTKNHDGRWKPNTTDLPIHWCDGNHENHDKLDAGDLSPRLTYQPRGSVAHIDDTSIMFFGGAHSVDLDQRTMGVDWWPQENITRAQLEAALAYDGKVDIMVTHDRPDNFPWPDFLRGSLKEGRANRVALEALWDKFRPRFWFHGHHHWGHDCEFEGTRMISCPIIESGLWTVLDGATIHKNWEQQFQWRRP